DSARLLARWTWRSSSSMRSSRASTVVGSKTAMCWALARVCSSVRKSVGHNIAHTGVSVAISSTRALNGFTAHGPGVAASAMRRNFWRRPGFRSGIVTLLPALVHHRHTLIPWAQPIRPHPPLYLLPVAAERTPGRPDQHPPRAHPHHDRRHGDDVAPSAAL